MSPTSFRLFLLCQALATLTSATAVSAQPSHGTLAARMVLEEPAQRPVLDASPLGQPVGSEKTAVPGEH